MILFLSLLASLGTITSMYMLARQNRNGWVVSLFNQLVWFLLIVHSHLWGLLPLQFTMLAIALHGWARWGKNA